MITKTPDDYDREALLSIIADFATACSEGDAEWAAHLGDKYHKIFVDDTWTDDTTAQIESEIYKLLDGL